MAEVFNRKLAIDQDRRETCLAALLFHQIARFRLIERDRYFLEGYISEPQE